MTAQLYVGTYAKYNSGSIKGAWLDLENYEDKDEFYGACAEVHKDESDPEYMFQDFQGFPKSFYSESSVPDELFEYIKSDVPDEVKEAYMACFNDWDEDQCNERYIGEFSSPADMAENFMEETGGLDEIPENLRRYFDFESFANDMRCNSEYAEDNGHYFWNY